MESAVRRLRPDGRIVVISYHSGEDRIVKRRFSAFARVVSREIVTRKPLRPTAQKSGKSAQPQREAAGDRTGPQPQGASPHGCTSICIQAAARAVHRCSRVRTRVAAAVASPAPQDWRAR